MIEIKKQRRLAKALAISNMGMDLEQFDSLGHAYDVLLQGISEGFVGDERDEHEIAEAEIESWLDVLEGYDAVEDLPRSWQKVDEWLEDVS